VRCGYTTNRKDSMHKHLYKIKKRCPSALNKIELSDEIKSDIMENRVHIIQDDKSKIIHVNVQNRQIQNIVMSMGPLEKLNHFLEYRGKILVGYGDQIEQKYKPIIDRLENNEYKYGFELDQAKFLDVIDQSMQVDSNNESYINVLFIQELNKIAMFHDDEWDSHLVEAGIQRIIKIIRDYYLESYEKYMLNKILREANRISAFDLNKYKLQLNEYYQFLACFDVYPAAYQKENCDLLPEYGHANMFHIEEYCMSAYSEIKSKLTKGEKNKMRKLVFEIIKNNTAHNIKNLNKSIIKLANVDEEFKTSILNKGDMLSQ